MKNFLLIPLLVLSSTITICAQSGGTQNSDGQTMPKGGKNLIVFYSWSGNSRTIANNLKSITMEVLQWHKPQYAEGGTVWLEPVSEQEYSTATSAK
ncbi:MAG: hypothetical protein LBQ88_14345 [Treponema sp.]|jgi:hypothetical protein|nr:hypothetical protein [Treponema sp.]